MRSPCPRAGQRCPAQREEAAQAADGAAAVSKVRLDLRRVRKELLEDAIALDSMFAADTPGKGGNPPALPEQDLVALPLYRRQYQAHAAWRNAPSATCGRGFG